MRLKGSPESKIILSCGHPVTDMDEAVRLELDDKTYSYQCKDCAEKMMKEGHARIYKQTEVTNGCPF
jgi:DNA-directed RNA polymerase subunit RPC12/RpoP